MVGRPIRVGISGRSADAGAPTAEDLLDQVGDYFAILRDVERMVADDGASEIEWRVTNASKRNPLELEVTPFPRRHAVDISNRERLVVEHANSGLAQLTHQSERPTYFTDFSLEKAERLFRRVTNGLGQMTIDSGGETVSPLEILPTQARSAATNVEKLRKPKDKPYREIGSLEGFLQRVERDGYGRSLLFVRLRLTGETVKCVARDSALTEVEHHEIGEVWKSQRIRVFGIIHYKGLGRIAQIESDAVQFLRSREDLPGPDDIVDEEFTQGLKSEDYLERLRSGYLP